MRNGNLDSAGSTVATPLDADADRLAHYDYALDGVRIAATPAAERDRSRLLAHDRAGATTSHRSFRDLPDLLRPGDLLVVNDTRVVTARLIARRRSGGRVEVVLHPTGSEEPDVVPALLRPSSRIARDERLEVTPACALRVLDPPGAELRRVRIEGGLAEALRAGSLALPPYLPRDGRDPELDRERYQTVYASAPGAIAAPTAGLHFTPRLLEEIAARGVGLARITLHVGPGTFLPIRSERLSEHRMHEESYEIGEEAAKAIARTRESGGRVVAVGTTTTRALESAALHGPITARRERTGLMIRPPHEFRAVDALVTNFHLPRTTLLALVCAFAGRERVLALYRQAAALGYRFYSYGDSMLLT